MLGVAGVMVPVVLIYQGWVYFKFSGPLSLESLTEDESY